MKYYFLLNPEAGKGNDLIAFREKIQSAAAACGKDAIIYETRSVGDAEVFVRSRLEEETEEPLAFIACGGDGTFNEVLNGCMGSPNGVCSLIPMGTGNDFVRNFPEDMDFNDIDALLNGDITRCDAIEYSGVIDGEFRVRYCANMINIGFDCNVVDKTAELKKKPFIAGSAAYLLGVAVTLIKKKGADLKILVNGETVSNGPILLTSIANGSYCGGGVMSNPYAHLQDGQIDISVIRDLGRVRFITLFPLYKKGEHLDSPKGKDVIFNYKAEEITVIPRKGTMKVCVDGEISQTEGILFRIQPNAFRLLAPKK